MEPSERWGALRRFSEPVPESPAGGAGRPGLLVALAVVGFVILLFRAPPSSWSIPWAEDGTVFLAQSLVGGPELLLQPYAGYLHVVARVMSETASWVGIEHAPLMLYIISAIVIAVTAVAVYVFAEHVIRANALRLAVWLAFVSLPVAAAELLNSAANVHWYLMAAAFWAVVVRARSRSVVAMQIITVVAAMLSDPLTAALLPILMTRLIVWRSRSDFALLIAFSGSLMIQIVGVVLGSLQGQREFGNSRPSVGEYLEWLSAHVALPALGGVRISTELVERAPLALPGIALGIVVGLAVAAIIRRRQRGLLVAVFPLGAAAFSAMVLVLQWRVLEPVPPFAFDTGSRYAAPAILLIVSGLSVAVDALSREGGRWTRYLALGTLFSVAAVGAIDYRVWDMRAEAPPWKAALDEAAIECEGPSDVARPMIAPVWFPAPEISCELLLVNQ